MDGGERPPLGGSRYCPDPGLFRVCRLKTATFIESALDLVAADALASSLLVDDALAGLRIRCLVQGERFDIVADPRTRVKAPDRSRPDARVRAKRQTLLALVDGETSLLDAVRGGGLDLTGPPPVLLRIAAAQRAFAEGAARVRRMEALLARYRGRNPGQKVRDAM